MKGTARFLSVGAVSGLALPLVLIAVQWVSLKDTAILLLAGALSGILVAFAIGYLLLKCGPWGALVFGCLSAPLGVFLCGFLYGLISHPLPIPDGLAGGLWGGIVSVLVYVLWFIPCAILTAFLLRAVLLKLACWPWALALAAFCSAWLAITLWWHPHGMPLSGSEAQLRASILKLTPLGTPFDETAARIHDRMHPGGLETIKRDGGLAGSARGMAPRVRSVWDQWPLGGEHHGREIACDLGSGGRWDEDDIQARWAFDDQGCLADVLVRKAANLP